MQTYVHHFWWLYVKHLKSLNWTRALSLLLRTNSKCEWIRPNSHLVFIVCKSQIQITYMWCSSHHKLMQIRERQCYAMLVKLQTYDTVNNSKSHLDCSEWRRLTGRLKSSIVSSVSYNIRYYEKWQKIVSFYKMPKFLELHKFRSLWNCIWKILFNISVCYWVCGRKVANRLFVGR